MSLAIRNANIGHPALESLHVRMNTMHAMLSPDPNFDYHYLVYVKTDPAKEPVAIGYSIPGTLADASHKTGRTKADFEVVEISREQYERIKETIFLRRKG
jgi:hypothetical protein